MTTKNQFGTAIDVIAGIFMSIILIVAPTLAYAKSAPLVEDKENISLSDDTYLMNRTSLVSLENSNNKKEKPKKKNRWKCDDELATWLYNAGFRGHNIREAWAIAMRESNGRPKTISNSDYGLFQFNYPSWGGKSWWSTSMLLTPEYNAKIAYQLSDGGKNWTPWGMNDHNEFNFSNYGMWSSWQLHNWIVEPYQRYYKQYPCKV